MKNPTLFPEEPFLPTIDVGSYFAEAVDFRGCLAGGMKSMMERPCFRNFPLT
jgi:hypothetical protein